MKPLVIIESPYAPDPKRSAEEQHEQLALHIRYLRACLRDSLLRGEAPYASHALYTQEGVLDDTVAGDRVMGIQAGFAWRQSAHLTAVYTDLGISDGMRYGIEDTTEKGRCLQYRLLPDDIIRKVIGE